LQHSKHAPVASQLLHQSIASTVCGLKAKAAPSSTAAITNFFSLVILISFQKES